MRKMSADAEGIVAYSATAEVMATDLATAAAGSVASDPTLLGPIMGLIGGDFVTAYAAAHAGHVAAIGQLSAVMASMGVATASAATTLVDTDVDNAAPLTSAAGDIGVEA
ncbi:type VII secretion target [Nocardia sp. NPDC055029]|uniref:type VII secretion target n=1 Tax=Nocardia sp. NPDC060259 TaxID=3347088 RepID=UPI00364C1FF5